MSLGESDELNISDGMPVDPALEASSLPKFDMHLYRSSLTEDRVTYLVKLYGILLDLHPRVSPTGMTMNALPPDAIGLYAHHFQQRGLWASEYDASDVEKLREVVISLRRPPFSVLYVAGLSNVWNHAGCAFILKDSEGKCNVPALLPNFKGCKITVGAFLPPRAARVTYLAPPANRLEDIPLKSGEMLVAEIPCRKVLDDKERKKRKAEEKTVAHAPASNTHAEVAVPKGAGGEGEVVVVCGCYAAAAVEVVRSFGWRLSSGGGHDDDGVVAVVLVETRCCWWCVASVVMEVAKKDGGGVVDVEEMTKTNMFLHPPVALVTKLVAGEGGEEGADNNEGVLSGLQARPSPAPPSGSRLKAMEEPAPEVVGPEVEASYSDGRFGNLPFTPNGGVRDESAIKRSWRLLCQSAQQQANVLHRFEALKQQHSDLEYTHSPTETEAQQLRADKQRYAVEAGRGEMVRQQIMNEYLPTFVRRLHQSAEYKRSLGEVFSLAVGKGFIDGVSIGRGDADVRAILEANPNVDLAASDTFMDAYEKLFDRRYLYVEKVSRMYLLDPSNLQNIMPDENGLNPGEGPRDTPTASYA
uniref:Uncharacterized protein n=1 Tax=Tanacetum cinerariifolium TaxID=118510 RepID=A0A6L2M0Q5_TANCI|nr:hypothetical protein [Tanacetum cinerariifolium]